MANLTQAQATAYLRELGWRIRSTNEFKQVVKLFQESWNLGAALEVDGAVGTNTSAAIRISVARKRAGKPTASGNPALQPGPAKASPPQGVGGNLDKSA